MDQLSGQKVMVTGARGFLGSHLCRRLCEMGAEVYGVSRTLHQSSKDDIRWREGNLEDFRTASTLLHEIEPDVVFHLAGHVTAAPDLEHVIPTFHSLLVSTVNLLTLATQIGCRRVVLTGSLTEPQPGHADRAPGSPYAAAKWAGNAYARMFKELYQTPVVIVRPFMVYGPRQDQRKLIPYVACSLLQGQAPELSSGQWQADWVYVGDVIDGFVTAGYRPGIEGGTIELGSGVLVSVRDLVGQIVELLGSSVKPLFGSLTDRPLEQVHVADIAYAYSRLGWKPKTSLTEGLKQTLDWYEKQLKVCSETVKSTSNREGERLL